jgi:glutamate-1-semialdehyde 2,1-aminomutase
MSTASKSQPDRWRVSSELLRRANRVTASARRDLEGTFPMIIDRAQGALVWDIDGNVYVDFTSSTGAILLGHRQAEVDEAVIEQVRYRGNLFPTTISEIQVNVAERLASMFPCAERVLFFRTGSCATTAAVRLARVFSGKSKVLTSGYHGWHDWHLHIFPRFRFADDTHFDFHYNLNLLEELLKLHSNDVACIILTPEPNFFGREYHEEIRKISSRHKTLLIFDEVVSGFRYGRGGVQELFKVKPDLATLGKGLANGYSLAAVVGRADVLASRDRTHLAGTFVHESIPLVAAKATLEIFERESIWTRLDYLGNRLLRGLQSCFADINMPIMAGNYPALFHIIFEIEEAAEMFFLELLSRGVLLHPFDPQMITAAHSEEQIGQALKAVKSSLDAVVAAKLDLFQFPLGASLSQRALDFRTLHEFGGTIRFRDAIEEVPVIWNQVDR